MELKSIAYNFFDKLSYSIEKDNWSEGFGGIIQFLVRFWDDNRCEYIEVRWPMT